MAGIQDQLDDDEDAEASMQSMTYGNLPSEMEFYIAFERDVPDGVYEIRAGASGADEDIAGDYSGEELYELLEELVEDWEEGDDAAGDQASAILSTLGFEWV